MNKGNSKPRFQVFPIGSKKFFRKSVINLKSSTDKKENDHLPNKILRKTRNIRRDEQDNENTYFSGNITD